MQYSKPFIVQIHNDEGGSLGLVRVTPKPGIPVTRDEIKAHWEGFKGELDYPEDFDNVWEFIEYLRKYGVVAERHFFSTDLDLYTNW